MSRTWTEEEKEEQRQRMLALHEEGRAGGQFGKLGGRPKKKRPQERMAERARDEGDYFYDKLIEVIENGRMGDRRQAIMNILEIVESERKIEVEEEQRFEDRSRTELVEDVRGQLAELLRRRVIATPGDIIDGRATEISNSELNPAEE
jgi:hypothetical protein